MSLALLDDQDEELTLDEGNPLALGTVTQGETSEPRRAKVKNTGAQAVYFVKVRAAPHPDAQAGPGSATYAATEFAAAQDGDFQDEFDLGTLEPGEARDVWVRWVVPASAAAGELVWAVEALGART